MQEREGVVGVSAELAELPEAGPLEKPLDETGAQNPITVIATNHQEMQAAQQVLIQRVGGRLARLYSEIANLGKNLALAKAGHLDRSRINAAISKARRRVVFYEKLKAALEAGYTLIPDMEVEVFAIRTTKQGPDRNYKQDTRNYDFFLSVDDQESNRPPVSVGTYVRPQPTIYRSKKEKGVDQAGKITYTREAWAEDWQEELLFPFSLAKVRIVEETTRALALKVFDNLGVLPVSRRNADPMVIGQVVLKEGWRERRMNFLICWFVDADTI